MPKKVLLTGASGFLGWNFSKIYQDSYDISGTYFRHKPKDVSIRWHKLNLLETKSVRKLIHEIAPDIIVHLAAISKPNYCENHPALSHHVNVYTSLEIAKVAENLNIPMIFSSTDLVFNGNTGGYTEDDFCYPLSQYGSQKQQAEESLLTDFKQTFILRFPLLFGWPPEYSHNFFTQSLSKLEEKESVQAFTDEYRTLQSANIASQWIDKMIQYLLSKPDMPVRLLHAGGSERYSRYDFMQLMSTVFELESSLIKACLQHDLNLIPQRPSDVSLDITLAEQLLGFRPPSILHQLQQLKDSRIIY